MGARSGRPGSCGQRGDSCGPSGSHEPPCLTRARVRNARSRIHQDQPRPCATHARTPGRGKQNPWQSRPMPAWNPPGKQTRGSSATGMVRLAVRAATQKPRSIVPRRVNARPTREKKNSDHEDCPRIGTRAPPDDGTNGTWAGIADEAIAPAGRSNTAKGHQNPMSVVNPAGIDQCPDPGC